MKGLAFGIIVLCSATFLRFMLTLFLCAPSLVYARRVYSYRKPNRRQTFGLECCIAEVTKAGS